MLFEGGAGDAIREKLLRDHDVRSPTACPIGVASTIRRLGIAAASRQDGSQRLEIDVPGGRAATRSQQMTYPGPHQPGAGDPHGASGPATWGQAPHGGYPPAGGYPGPGPYGQPYPGPYGPPYGGYPYAPPQRTNGMAIASMVLGILWLYWIGSVLALVFGYLATRQIRERGEAGGGMATAGIVLGWIGVGFLGLGILFGIAAAGS